MSLFDFFSPFTWNLIGIFLLLFLSAFFSSSETALTAASRAKMHQQAKQGNRAASTVNSLRQDSESLLGAILLGNNLVNILGTALATALLTSQFGEVGLAYATVIMTSMVVIFAEVLPKTYAFSYPDDLALRVARPIRWWLWLSWPITKILRGLAMLFLRPFGLGDKHLADSLADEEELRGVIDLHGRTALDEESDQERAMLRSILDLGDVNVAQVMTHRRNVVALDINQDPAQLVEAVLASSYTRIPLWEESDGNIIGLLHVKALLRALQQNNDLSQLDIRKLTAKPWFIPETANLLDQLQAFRKRREHFAIVVDEYGSLRGIVTLEDILEEIVGDIDDELDAPVTGVKQHGDGKSWLVQGDVAIRDLNREFEWYLPDNNAATLAGLVLFEARKIPEQGQVFTFYDFRFEILQRQRNQIALIKVTPPNTVHETP